jgi:hypothetical protein
MGLPVRGVNAGETASGKNRFVNMKAEMWWRTREWFDQKDVRIPNDERLIGQLSTIKYKFTSSGKIQIESKEDYGKRMAPDEWGDKSPDEADAFVLTMAGGTQRLQEKRYQEKPRKLWRRSPWTR